MKGSHFLMVQIITTTADSLTEHNHGKGTFAQGYILALQLITSKQSKFILEPIIPTIKKQLHFIMYLGFTRIVQFASH